MGFNSGFKGLNQAMTACVHILSNLLFTMLIASERCIA